MSVHLQVGIRVRTTGNASICWEHTDVTVLRGLQGKIVNTVGILYNPLLYILLI